MPSFDIVSEINNDEARNAVDNAERELSTRYDFRGVEASFEWKKDETTLSAETDFQLDQMVDILRNKLVKRKIDPMTMDIGKAVHSGKTFSLKVTYKEGIDATTAKQIVKLIKDSKVKVQAAIQGEQVRVTGKKRDDLQAAMAKIREEDLGQPLQFNNFRD
ncbi:MAG: YajQ family cyclic di-GMP-binding protein [Alteromonadaceae bacterium]|nr:MAG: YajQ family cyclic di-GMP-binding protein [Alteromonadaceae bacterium]